MGVLELSTVSLAVLSVVGCSAGLSSDPTLPAKAVFDPLLQSKQRAVDQNSYALRRAPCIRSLARPTRLTRNTQTGSY
jgi:hypothetical protein